MIIFQIAFKGEVSKPRNVDLDLLATKYVEQVLKDLGIKFSFKDEKDDFVAFAATKLAAYMRSFPDRTPQSFGSVYYEPEVRPNIAQYHKEWLAEKEAESSAPALVSLGPKLDKSAAKTFFAEHYSPETIQRDYVYARGKDKGKPITPDDAKSVCGSINGDITKVYGENQWTERQLNEIANRWLVAISGYARKDDFKKL